MWSTNASPTSIDCYKVSFRFVGQKFSRNRSCGSRCQSSIRFRSSNCSWCRSRRRLLNRLQISPSLKRRVSLPSIPSKMRLKAFDATYLAKAKATLQQFLDIVLKDTDLCNCEAVYSFFNEIPPSLLQPQKQTEDGVLKKTLNFLPSFFKSKIRRFQIFAGRLITAASAKSKFSMGA